MAPGRSPSSARRSPRDRCPRGSSRTRATRADERVLDGRPSSAVYAMLLERRPGGLPLAQCAQRLREPVVGSAKLREQLDGALELLRMRRRDGRRARRGARAPGPRQAPPPDTRPAPRRRRRSLRASQRQTAPRPGARGPSARTVRPPGRARSARPPLHVAPAAATPDRRGTTSPPQSGASACARRYAAWAPSHCSHACSVIPSPPAASGSVGRLRASPRAVASPARASGGNDSSAIVGSAGDDRGGAVAGDCGARPRAIAGARPRAIAPGQSTPSAASPAAQSSVPRPHLPSIAASFERRHVSSADDADSRIEAASVRPMPGRCAAGWARCATGGGMNSRGLTDEFIPPPSRICPPRRSRGHRSDRLASGRHE